MPPVDVNMLRNVDLLRGADRSVLEALAGAASEQVYQPGEIILREGARGGEMYLILEGSVEVLKGRDADESLLALRGVGELIGEMAFLEDRPRFATVRAREACRLLAFSEQGLSTALLAQPRLLLRVVRALSGRLREADLQMIADLQRKNVELAQAYRDLKLAQAGLVEKERLERELELARDLQQSILPVDFPRPAGFSFAATSRPARQVGGDFYDVISLSKGRIGLVMADVSDKGMPSALYMALTHSLVHVEAKRRASPRQVLLAVHNFLLEMSRADMFVTVFYGILDPAESSLTYVRAGHDCPLLFEARSGACRLLTAQGMLLGMLADVTLEERSVSLEPGDMLVLYSDGVTDATSPDGEFFGIDRLREALCAAARTTAQEACDLVLQRVDTFRGGADPYDDIALLIVRAEDTT